MSTRPELFAQFNASTRGRVVPVPFAQFTITPQFADCRRVTPVFRLKPMRRFEGQRRCGPRMFSRSSGKGFACRSAYPAFEPLIIKTVTTPSQQEIRGGTWPKLSEKPQKRRREPF